MTRLASDIAAALDAMARRKPMVRLQVQWLETTDSTMNVAASLAADGAPAGTVVGADEQTAGRGRRGRSWQSPPGAGLYFSWLCRPALEASALPLLTLAAGVGVHYGIRQATDLVTELKWPNDVLVDGRKVAGILAEGCGLGSPNQAVIVGVGINVRHAAYPPEVAARATSLEAELGGEVDRGHLLAAILAGLTDAVGELERDRDGILRTWREAAPGAVGTPVEWADPTGMRQGTAAGIDERGALLIRTADSLERVVAGEVRWLR